MSPTSPGLPTRLAALACLAAYAAGCATPCAGGGPPPEPEQAHHHADHGAEPAGHHAGAADDALVLSAPCDCGCQDAEAQGGPGTAPGQALWLAALAPLPPAGAMPGAEPPQRTVSAPIRPVDHVPIPATA